MFYFHFARANIPLMWPQWCHHKENNKEQQRGSVVSLRHCFRRFPFTCVGPRRPGRHANWSGNPASAPEMHKINRPYSGSQPVRFPQYGWQLRGRPVHFMFPAREQDLHPSQRNIPTYPGQRRGEWKAPFYWTVPGGIHYRLVVADCSQMSAVFTPFQQESRTFSMA